MHTQSITSTLRISQQQFGHFETDAPTLQDVFKGQPIETLAAGEAIFWEGDRSTCIFEVVEGVLRVYKLLSDGRRAITGFIHKGEVLGVSFQDRYLFTAEAVTAVKVRRFARNRFYAVVNASPELRPQLFARLCDEMAAAQDQMILLGRKSAEERVASFLLAVRRKTTDGTAQPIELPMSRLDMADYLGLTIETVSRIMSKFARRGLIASAGRHAIVVRRLGDLRELAGVDDEEEEAGEASFGERQAVWPS